MLPHGWDGELRLAEGLTKPEQVDQEDKGGTEYLFASCDIRSAVLLKRALGAKTLLCHHHFGPQVKDVTRKHGPGTSSQAPLKPSTDS